MRELAARMRRTSANVSGLTGSLSAKWLGVRDADTELMPVAGEWRVLVS
jgi:hypothetical protein